LPKKRANIEVDWRILAPMTMDLPITASDLRGMTRLAVEATAGVTDLVEDLHHGMGHPLEVLKGQRELRGKGVKGFVYEAIRVVTRWVGGGVDAALSPLPSNPGTSDQREALLATLNGVVGDHLAATGNPLAIAMSLGPSGEPDRPPGGRLLVLVHGLCRNDRHWRRNGHDHGAALARDLGYTPLYLRYNSGLHISANGKQFAELLEAHLAQWPVPVESLAILAHSMGGLVARSACHQAAQAGHGWLGSLRHLIFLGTPHHGSVLERGGHLLERILDSSPLVGPLARLGKVRSAGITDLRHGNLLEGDWQGRDRFGKGGDARAHVPLPVGVRSCTLAVTTGEKPGAGRLLGDGLVPLASALGRHREPSRCLGFPEDAVWVGRGMNHMDLLDRLEVYEQIRNQLQVR
jgi:pimeloyl-ACP methyl ester carboxylesterase